MMNGYSVTEAASVLGVPTERVWELLARGVLAGAPEGETGMRVFLQPRAAPPSITATDEAASGPTNGPEREMSPFRELLTEFRNLTERYGQALLALGESRGEVASLRSRVDLLEARIDLRLPMGAPAASPWPTQPLPVSEPAEPGSRREVAEAADEGHRPRSRGARRATESFAEAMARTEDPSPADLPPSTGAEGGAQPAEGADDLDRSLPRDVLPAEQILVADAEEPGAEEPEFGPILVADAAESAFEPVTHDEAPEASVDEHVATAAQTEPAIAPMADEVDEPIDGEMEAVIVGEVPEPVAAEIEATTTVDEDHEAFAESSLESAAVSEPIAPAALEPDEQLEDGPTAGLDEDAWAADVADLGADEQPAMSPASEPDGVDEVAPDARAAGSEHPGDDGAAARSPDEGSGEGEAAPQEFDAERYSTVIEQPDWFEAEADDEWPSAQSSADEQGEPSGEPEAPDARGADEMEVAGGGHAAAEADDQPEGLPGSRELGDAMDAYGELGRTAPESIEPDDEWPPSRAIENPSAPSSYNPVGFVVDPPRRPHGSVTSVGPANRAYRRLRRIFPT